MFYANFDFGEVAKKIVLQRSATLTDILRAMNVLRISNVTRWIFVADEIFVPEFVKEMG
jgi:hypothetical protein